MTLQPLFDAGPLVAGHAIGAITVVVLGAAQFALPKGTRWHRLVGWIGVALMAGVALSGFGIHGIRLVGPFSPIHLLSLLVLILLAIAIRAARRHDIDRHRRFMVGIYALGFVLAGLFTLLPGRVMHQVAF